MGNEAVPANYVPILVFIGIAIAFGAVSLLAGWFVRPSRPYRAKLAPYESGSPLFSGRAHPVSDAVLHHRDAVCHFRHRNRSSCSLGGALSRRSGLVGLVEMSVFIGILLVGFWYAWKKGALEWD